MEALTPIGALIIGVILLPVVGVLWLRKADNSAIDSLTKDHEHIRQWLTSHEASDERMFKELREGHQAISRQLADNFQTLILEIRRAGNGNH